MELSEIRVLHITNGLDYGGVQKIIYQLCLGTKDRFDKVIVASIGGVYVERLKKIGIEHITIPDIVEKNPFQVLKILLIIKKIVNDNRINVIHCHHRMAVFYAKLVGGKVKIIYNNHTIYSDKPKFSHYVLKNINLIADGAKAKDNLLEFFGLDEKCITTINNAVDEYDGIEIEIPEISVARESGYFIVMNSARLHPQKGMSYFIEAAKILIAEKCKIKFFIVGDGPLKEELLDMVKKYNLENDVIFLGFRKDIKNTIKQADILVLTSVYEGLPLTPMEAFSVGVPVVATNIDGTKEVISNYVNGLLVDAQNPKAIAEGIMYFYHNVGLLMQYGENAYKTYYENFSIENFSERYLDFYSKL